MKRGSNAALSTDTICHQCKLKEKLSLHELQLNGQLGSVTCIKTTCTVHVFRNCLSIIISIIFHFLSVQMYNYP